MSVLAGTIFAAALLVIAFEWVHRTKVALVGAALVVTLGVLENEQAIDAIDWNTLGLLTGMMIIVGLTERTGVFSYLALRAAQVAGASPLRLVFLLAATTAVMSAFLDNLTAILLVVPMTLLLADLLKVSPLPLILVEIFACNIGGTATLIGDPPNIMIGTHVPQLTFTDFIVNLAPVSTVTLLVVTAGLYFVFRKSLHVEPERAARVRELDAAKDIRESKYLKRSLAILGGTLVGFFLHAPLHLEPSTVALTGATVMLLFAADDVENALERVEWSTLFFFAGLFVMVGALEEHGIVGGIAEGIADLTGGSRSLEALGILWGAAFGSALVDNIPFTAAMIPVVDTLQVDGFDDATWWALALGACFGGNATVIAAAANVAAAGILDRTGHPISFTKFALLGIPVTAASLAIATVYLVLFQL